MNRDGLLDFRFRNIELCFALLIVRHGHRVHTACSRSSHGATGERRRFGHPENPLRRGEGGRLSFSETEYRRRWINDERYRLADPPPSATLMPMRQARMRVLFDDECGFCRARVRQLQRLDWLKQLEFVPLTSPRVQEWGAGLDRETLLSQIHCVDSQGGVLGGARCLRQLGLRIPLLMPLAVGLWIPGAIWVADQVYRWVSRHRHSLSRCNDSP